MSAFDAVNHAFSIAATGGFSTRNLSIGYYQSDLINIIVMFYMAVSAMHFGLIYASALTRSLKPLNNSVVKYYFGSIIVMSVVIMLSLKLQGGYESWGRAAMDSTFTVISYMTTTGFGICDNSVWPWLAGIVLLLAAFQCGCSGSTTGGIKVDRVLISFKAVGNEIKRRLHPSSVSQVRLSGQYLPDSTVNSVFMYIVLYFLVIFISIIGVLLTGAEVPEAVSGVIASLGSVGPGLADVGALDNYSLQPVMAKIIYTLDMFLGRVEIYPVLIVISLMFKRNR
jgi:trk system potassium uptake protein TrkH